MVNSRRIQLSGSTTLSVSLPKAWVNRFNIQKGDGVFFSDLGDGTLLLSSKSPAVAVKTVSIDVDSFSMPDDLRRTFIASYLAGNSSFVFYSKHKISSPLQQAIFLESKRLMSLEVVEESDSKIVVSDFFSPKNLSLDKALKRLHSIVEKMHSELDDLLLTRNVAAYSGVVSKEDEVDRLHFLVSRQIFLALSNSSLLSELGLTPSDCLYYFKVVSCLEKMGDDLVKASAYLNSATGVDERFFKKVKDFNDFCCSMHSRAFNSFFDRDVKTALSVLNDASALVQKHDLLEKKLSNEAFQIGVALDSLHRIGLLAIEVAEVVVDRG